MDGLTEEVLKCVCCNELKSGFKFGLKNVHVKSIWWSGLITSPKLTVIWKYNRFDQMNRTEKRDAKNSWKLSCVLAFIKYDKDMTISLTFIWYLQLDLLTSKKNQIKGKRHPTRPNLDISRNLLPRAVVPNLFCPRFCFFNVLVPVLRNKTISILQRGFKSKMDTLRPITISFKSRP